MCSIAGPITFAVLVGAASYFIGRYYGSKAGYARAEKTRGKGRIRKGWAKKNTSS